MATDHILAMLLSERDRLNRAIEALQGPSKRRGRPPRSEAGDVTEIPVARRRRPKRTAAQRKAQSERMRKYWAQRRKEK